MTNKEFEGEFRTAFYKADAKSIKATTHIVAITNPTLGNTWFT